MVQVAKTVLKDQPSNIVHSNIESWEYPSNQFDLVISRLALHFAENITGGLVTIVMQFRKSEYGNPCYTPQGS